MADGSETIEEGLLLRVTSGARAGEVIPLVDREVTVGRDPGNTLELADRVVSRYHARIHLTESAWVLTDLSSRNGTRLNGVRIVRAGLQPGDEIGIGETLLTVDAGSA